MLELGLYLICHVSLKFQPYPVIWRENQQPGKITELHAKDNDGPENGPPFTYAIAPIADEEIKLKFGIYSKISIAIEHPV